MRQAGFLAAAGIYALDHHVERLKDDHTRARQIGKMLSQLGFVDEIHPIETNIVIFRLNEKMPVEKFLKSLAGENILAVQFGKQSVRMVTHLEISDEMLGRFEEVFKKLF